MLRSILVGLDGSEYTEPAMKLAMHWGKEFNALVNGVGIVDEPTIRAPEPVPIGGSYFKAYRDEHRITEARKRIEALLATFNNRCDETGSRCRIIHDVGDPVKQMVLEAQRSDLVLLGRQTYYRLDTQEGPDQTLTQLLKLSPRPVVTVPEKLPTGSSVVVAYDGSLQAARTLQLFANLGLHLGHDVHLLHIQSSKTELPMAIEMAVDYLTAHNIDAYLQVAQANSPGAGILEHIKKVDAGLLVVGAYGKSTLQDFLFGSVTRMLLRDCPIPMFMFH